MFSRCDNSVSCIHKNYGEAHWEVLLRARQLNQAYVIASAQGGAHNSGRETWGHSMIIDPWAI